MFLSFLSRRRDSYICYLHKSSRGGFGTGFCEKTNVFCACHGLDSIHSMYRTGNTITTAMIVPIPQNKAQIGQTQKVNRRRDLSSSAVQGVLSILPNASRHNAFIGCSTHSKNAITSMPQKTYIIGTAMQIATIVVVNITLSLSVARATLCEKKGPGIAPGPRIDA